ncbi:MAG: preprotein translocase subunit SecE [Nitrospinota bacterium]
MKQGKIAQFIEYLKDVKIESKKITWPSKKDTIATTYATIISVILMGFYLGIVDVGLSKIIEKAIQ